jgi:hypothetical protein
MMRGSGPFLSGEPNEGQSRAAFTWPRNVVHPGEARAVLRVMPVEAGLGVVNHPTSS